jgi:hypothetical protein
MERINTAVVLKYNRPRSSLHQQYYIEIWNSSECFAASHTLPQYLIVTHKNNYEIAKEESRLNKYIYYNAFVLYGKDDVVLTSSQTCGICLRVIHIHVIPYVA